MKNKLVLLAGAAAGYVLGTRAGRERYEQIKDSANRMWHSPKVQEKVSGAENVVTDAAKSAVDTAGSKIGEFMHRSDNGEGEAKVFKYDDEDDVGVDLDAETDETLR